MFVTRKVSGITSKETISFLNSITVRQTPLTAILAPFSKLLRKFFETLISSLMPDSVSSLLEIIPIS